MSEPTYTMQYTATVDDTICFRSDCNRFIFHYKHGWLEIQGAGGDDLEYVIINRKKYYLNL